MRRIYSEYLAGRGLYAIAQDLTADGVPSPSAHDPARNRHRDGRAWSNSAVRAILANPRYTGRQVWNRQRRDEVLLDVDDVAAGHQVKLRWNDRDAWIWSAEPTHEPLVDGDTFAKAAEIAAASAHRPAAAKRRTTARHYPLSGLIHCSACGRRMQGTYAHGTSRYRCRYPSEYAIANQLHHPLTVYVREDALAGPLDRWIAALFAPDQLDATCAALAAAGDGDEAADARAEAARRLVADCDQRLARYRGALDAGADPAVVAQWMAEVRGDRLRAEAELAAAAPAEPLAEAELRALVADLGSLAAELQREDPTARTRTYQALGVHLTYDHTNGLVTATATATPCSTARVGGGTPSEPSGNAPPWGAFHGWLLRGGALPRHHRKRSGGVQCPPGQLGGGDSPSVGPGSGACRGVAWRHGRAAARLGPAPPGAHPAAGARAVGGAPGAPRLVREAVTGADAAALRQGRRRRRQRQTGCAQEPAARGARPCGPGAAAGGDRQGSGHVLADGLGRCPQRAGGPPPWRR